MRAALLALALVGLTATAHADGELTLRGVYYKERSTRVEQPMLDGHFDVGDAGTIDGHLLVDAITSASVASGATGTPFSEKRVEGGLGYAHVFGDYTAGVAARYSTEPDYQSAFVTARGQAELLDKNLTLGLTVGAGHDHVDNSAVPTLMPVEGTLDTALVSASVAQILDENTIVSLVYDLSYLDGFQQNPYRVVSFGGSAAQERHPATRTRQAAAVMVRRFVPALVTTVIASYRLYRDDWGVLGHTPELRVLRELGDEVTVGAAYRFHHQRGADFYQASYQAAPADGLVTADAKLSDLDTHTLTAKLDVTGAAVGLDDRWADVRGEVILEYYLQSAEFGNAIIAHAALTVPFAY